MHEPTSTILLVSDQIDFILCSLLFFKFVHFLYLFSRCNNQQYCDISAENNNFGGDPCPNIPKYLEVYFGCFDGKFFFYLWVI